MEDCCRQQTGMERRFIRTVCESHDVKGVKEDERAIDVEGDKKSQEYENFYCVIPVVFVWVYQRICFNIIVSYKLEERKG